MSADGRKDLAVTEAVRDPDAALNDDLTPEFRVVLVAQKRRGIRLERLYWRLLDEIAARRGEKRSRLVASIIEKENNDNIASLLRGFVARTLEVELGANSNALSENFFIDLLQQAPVPAFAINQQKKLCQVNQEFIQLLRVLGGDMAGKVAAELVQLTLDTPTEELFKRLENATSVHCNYVIQIDAKQRRGRVKTVGIPPSPHKMLVGYVVS